MTSHETSHESSDATSIESIPTAWDDVRDGQFFRIVAHVLDAHLLEAATSLLAANDAELAPSA